MCVCDKERERDIWCKTGQEVKMNVITRIVKDGKFEYVTNT